MKDQNNIYEIYKQLKLKKRKKSMDITEEIERVLLNNKATTIDKIETSPKNPNQILTQRPHSSKKVETTKVPLPKTALAEYSNIQYSNIKDTKEGKEKGNALAKESPRIENKQKEKISTDNRNRSKDKERTEKSIEVKEKINETNSKTTFSNNNKLTPPREKPDKVDNQEKSRRNSLVHTISSQAHPLSGNINVGN